MALALFRKLLKNAGVRFHADACPTFFFKVEAIGERDAIIGADI
jgi:hypothetical protein